MNMRKHIINLLFAAVAFMTGCSESLEDTYSDFTGDGKIRYVAKCSDLDITAGWERLIVTWVNGTDATIDKIKVAWLFEGRRDSAYLPGTATSFELTDLADGTYQFYVSAVDKFGNESLIEAYSGRPYTRDHELMRSFSQGVLKAYFLKGKMIFFSDQYNDNIVDMQLQYKNAAGETKYYKFKNPDSYNTLVTIDDVSANPMDTVYVLRTGILENSPDSVVIDPTAISRKKNFSAGFVHAITARYGYSTDTQEKEDEFLEFIENAEELEFDYSIESLEDILFCTNLKKLVVGKNRYFTEQATRDNRSQILKNDKNSYAALSKAAEDDILGLKVEYYGNQSGTGMHYFDKVYPFMTYMSFSAAPDDLEIIPASAFKEYEDGNKIYCETEDIFADWDVLLDNNKNTFLQTSTQPSMRTYEMYMELEERTAISGIKVTQIVIPRNDRSAPYFLPDMMVAQTSLDGVVWEDVTFLPSNDLGRVSGEVTLLKIAEDTREVKHIKITIRDGSDPSGNWSCRLAGIDLYK